MKNTTNVIVVMIANAVMTANVEKIANVVMTVNAETIVNVKKTVNVVIRSNDI